MELGSLESWLAARVVNGAIDRVKRSEAFADFKAWRGTKWTQHYGPQRFVQAMHVLGYNTVRQSDGRYFAGIRLRDGA